MKINIVCVGKIKEKFFLDAIDEYKKRLSDNAISDNESFIKKHWYFLSKNGIKIAFPSGGRWHAKRDG